MFCVIITLLMQSVERFFSTSGVRSTGAVTAVPPPENSCNIYTATYNFGDNLASGTYSNYNCSDHMSLH